MSLAVTPVVTPPAVSAKMPSFRQQLDGIDDFGSEMSSAQPPDSRIRRRAKGRRRGAMASERAMYWLLRLVARQIALHAVGIGETAGSLRAKELHRFGFDPAEMREFAKALAIFPIKEPPAMGQPRCRGVPSQSCSAIS